MNNIKKYSFILLPTLLTILFLMVVFWPKAKPANDFGIKNNKIYLPTPDFYTTSPKQIDWNIQELDKVPTTIDSFLVEGYKSDKNREIEWRNTLAENYIDNKQIYNVDENYQKLEFSLNVESKKDIQSGSLSNETLMLNFYKLFENIFNTSDLKIKINSTEYKNYLYPWWVSANEQKHDVVQFLADYDFRGLPIINFDGFAINVNYFTNGKVVKVQARLPFTKIIKSTTVNTVDFNELKNRMSDKFWIWKVDGGKDYELSSEETVINKVNINNGKLVYIYDIKTSILWPFYLLEGESSLSTGKAKVWLLTEATK